ANLDRFAEIEQAEQEQRILTQLEHWLFPPAPTHLDGPRAKLHVFAEVCRAGESSALHTLKVHFNLFRPRTGEKHRSIPELIDLTSRATHEQELFAPLDWEFLVWLAENYGDTEEEHSLTLSGLDLLQWLARWGHNGRLECPDRPSSFEFRGQIAELAPYLENGAQELSFTHRVQLPNGDHRKLAEARFF